MCQYPRVPRWKDDEDRGDFGAWLSAQVGDRTFDWLAAEMAKRGHHHGADYYRAMASGNKPPGRVIGRALREFFGAPPLPVAPTEGGLAAAVNALVGELREWRTEDRARLAELEATVQALVGANLAERETEGAAAQRALQGNAG